jgi:hypothetical protein
LSVGVRLGQQPRAAHAGPVSGPSLSRSRRKPGGGAVRSYHGAHHYRRGRLFAEGGQFNVHRLVVATVGCNVAWGVIGVVLFVLGGLFHRSRRARFHRTLRSVRGRTAALAALQLEFPLEDEPLEVRPDDCARLYESLLTLSAAATPARPRLGRQDFVAAFIIFVLVSATALPGATPLLLLADSILALHVSNWLLILLLFSLDTGGVATRTSVPGVPG